VAVFDTAFHQTLPPHAFLYAVPYSLYREHGIRRYGFHGTSHRSAAHEALRRLKMPESGSRILIAHLGNGCSATAVRDGCSLDTSMGQSPLEGLVMGTRSGDVDPALHERLADLRGLDIAGVTSLLNRESGLLGLSELSGDMRELEAAAFAGHAGALRAIEVFCYRLAKTLASLVVPLGGLDALVFTGGIGENSAATRERTVNWLEPLGLSLDPQRNQNNGTHADGFVSPDGKTPILVVTCDEEVAIAEETASKLAESR
jgi:acetate kinase